VKQGIGLDKEIADSIKKRDGGLFIQLKSRLKLLNIKQQKIIRQRHANKLEHKALA